MNIAHIVPHSVTFPLSSHNGRYEWVLRLALLQKKAGHNVTIYCNPASHIAGLASIGIDPISDNKIDNNIETLRLAFRGDHDIYHSHFDNLHYQVAHETTKTIIYTQHWWPDEKTIELAASYSSDNVWAVPPTRYMHAFDVRSGIATKGYIYHGIDLTLFDHEVLTPKTDRFLFVSRIAPEKNLDIALSAVLKSGAKLDIIGKIAPKNQGYWDKLQPLIDGSQIRYLGAKNQTELVHYYSAARALLFPSDVNEPFGLVAIESQACGTPVIMKLGGSRGELIENGTTGFLCDTETDFINAIENVHKLSSDSCREFAKKFDITDMVEQYSQLYSQLVRN